MSDALKNDYDELQNKILRNATVDKEFQREAFFECYSEVASEAGDVPDLNLLTIRHEGRVPYQVDGFALDESNHELCLAITNYENSIEIQTLNAADSNKLFNRAIRFFKQTLSNQFIEDLEEASDAFYLADLIRSKMSFIKRVRVILLTNAKSVSKKAFETEKMDNLLIVKNLFDIVRYSKVISSLTGSEPISIHIADFQEGGLPCLSTPSTSKDYESYLCVMPGELLANIYATFGTKLLEQNVRVFLQARTKVNKGILETIRSKPEMFFAYNNGITATASALEVENTSSGGLVVKDITNLQIVNGGQTTASILYAKDMNKADLSQVAVQMKLSIIPPEKTEEVVPSISRYSNLQNKINEADFYASHPFHSLMESKIKVLLPPRRDGETASSHWFYERARGQYKNAQTYMSQADRKRFLAAYPKSQLIEKTGLAKVKITFEEKPYIVSRGAQKSFMLFMDGIKSKWEKDQNSFNELYIRNSIAQTIIFRDLDSAILKSEWYKNDRGYKAQIVTYTIAYLINYLNSNKNKLDYEKIWKTQSIGSKLLSTLDQLAQEVSQFLKDPPPSVRNVGEYCKKDGCWSDLKSKKLLSNEDCSSFIISSGEAKEKEKGAREIKLIDNEIEFDILIYKLPSHATKIKGDGQRLKLLTPMSNRALEKLERNNFSLTKAEKNVLYELLEKLKEFDHKYV